MRRFAKQDVQGCKHILETTRLAYPTDDSLIDESRSRHQRTQMNFEEVLIAVSCFAIFCGLRTYGDDLVPCIGVHGTLTGSDKLERIVQETAMHVRKVRTVLL